MIEVELFKPYHIDLLLAQGVQLRQVSQVQVPASYASLARLPGPAFTGRVGDQILMCGGMIPMGPAMGVLWALLSEAAASHMLALHRGVRRFLEINPPRRLEATVEKGFPQGCRWLELLGFKAEGEMPGYGLQGETHIRYGKVR